MIETISKRQLVTLIFVACLRWTSSFSRAIPFVHPVIRNNGMARGYRHSRLFSAVVNTHTSTAPGDAPSVALPPASVVPHPSKGIIFVDPFSDYHGEYLMSRALNDYGAGVVRVVSPYIAKGLATTTTERSSREDGDNAMEAAPLSKDKLSKWLDSIPFPIVAVVCESDSGLDYAERLACAIESTNKSKNGGRQHVVGVLRHNGHNPARRDKFEMNQACNDAGIATVKQALCTSVLDAVQTATDFGVQNDEENDHEETTSSVIVKPRRGVASDRVSLCSNLASVQAATERILDTTVYGTYDTKHEAVLMQEFVPGDEYAIDMVSKNGVHKTAALWVYDKTSTSEDGSDPFAYMSGKLVSYDDPCHPMEEIVHYVESVLTALGIQWGMTHTEVKVTPNGDIRLIEVNVRQQNDNFGPLCLACVGYTAMDMCLSAYLDDSNNKHDETNLFESVPRVPLLRHHGMIVNLACYVEGKVSQINNLDKIQELQSFVAHEIFPAFRVGSTVSRTKDIRSDCGWVHLIHEDEDVMMQDYKKICEWMRTMFDVVAVKEVNTAQTSRPQTADMI